MSGLAIACGNPSRSEVEAMMRAIAHRGSYASGLHDGNQIVLGQNYLKADGATTGDGFSIPVRDISNPDQVICYDGQIGNWPELAMRHGVSDGPFREERLILVMYQKYGRRMLDHLSDAIFAMVISDGKEMFAARDLLGIKTLFYGRKNGSLYLASELKAVLQITGEVYEFPNGHYMDSTGDLHRFAELPSSPPEPSVSGVDSMARDIREIVERSFRNRIDFGVPTGGLLSGGMDSSVVNYVGSKEYRKKFGQSARLKTFALGVGESEDIRSARIMASHIDSEHHELIVDLGQLLDVLPEVIFYLESFDPSLVRSAVSNYLISRYASQQGIRLLLSGEGGDEVFCGYTYLKDCSPEELFFKQMECIGFLHSNASLRLDRMNMASSVRVVAPLISGELLRYALTIPPEYKQRPDGDQKVEKWIFRKAYENILPDSIVWRGKQEFSQGSGSAGVLPAYFEEQVADHELTEARLKHPFIRTKEELHYFRLFTGYFGSSHAVQTVGQWICV